MRHVTRAGLAVADVLADFVETEALPGTGVEAGAFWDAFAAIVRDLAPRNRELLSVRDRMQARIDEWHRANGAPSDMAAYRGFLKEIGYLVDEGPDFRVETSGVDAEIGRISGPQLVVPVMNARFALNAANARWGSLYDALYGTDAIGEDGGRERGGRYNPVRGAAVVAWTRAFLDEAVPLRDADWAAVRGFRVADGTLVVALDGGETALERPEQLAGYLGDAAAPKEILLRNNGLGIRVLIDPATPIGRDDPAHISDVWLEAAVTTIMDCEDSVAAVDAPDKVVVYRNWLGLMKGDLVAEIEKGGRRSVRRLNPDVEFRAPDGSAVPVRSRALMLVRNVGHLMTTPAIRDAEGRELPEGIMDAMLTAVTSLHDVGPSGRRANSAAGVGLRGEAEDARARGGRLRRRALRSRGGGARDAARHAEGRDHGRGTPDDGEPQGVHPGGEEPHRLHQHRLPRPDRRRDPHLDGGRRGDPEGRDERGHLVQGLRGLERRHRARLRPARARADRQGDVGGAGHDGGDAEGEGGAAGGGGEHRLGALAHRGDAACDPLPPGEGRRGAGGDRPAQAGAARGHPDPAGR